MKNFSDLRKKDRGSNKIIEKIANTSYKKYIPESLRDDRFTQAEKDQIEEIISNPDNYFFRYIDPNYKSKIFEVGWDIFSSSLYDSSLEINKANQSLQYKSTSNMLTQKGSTCFLVAVACLTENRRELVATIKLIEKKEQEEDLEEDSIKIPLSDALKDKNFQADGFDSLINQEDNTLNLTYIFLDFHSEKTQNLLSKLTRETKDFLYKKYYLREIKLTKFTNFVLEKYIRSIESDDDFQFNLKKIKEEYKEQEQQMSLEVQDLNALKKSLEIINQENYALFNKLSEISGVPRFDLGRRYVLKELRRYDGTEKLFSLISGSSIPYDSSVYKDLVSVDAKPLKPAESSFRMSPSSAPSSTSVTQKISTFLTIRNPLTLPKTASSFSGAVPLAKTLNNIDAQIRELDFDAIEANQSYNKDITKLTNYAATSIRARNNPDKSNQERLKIFQKLFNDNNAIFLIEANFIALTTSSI